MSCQRVHSVKSFNTCARVVGGEEVINEATLLVGVVVAVIAVFVYGAALTFMSPPRMKIKANGIIRLPR